MSNSTDIQQARRLLDGLELGGLHNNDAVILADELDPVLVFAIVRFLRDVYPASDPAATGVLERVVHLTDRQPVVIQKVREGEADPISAWFLSEHDFREYRGRGGELLELLVDKLES